MFLRQIVLQKGIPFEMKLPKTAPLTYGSLTKEQFDKEIEKGMSDVKAGRVYSADAIEAEMKRDFGIWFFYVAYSAEARQDLRDIYEYIAYELLIPETAAGQWLHCSER